MLHILIFPAMFCVYTIEPCIATRYYSMKTHISQVEKTCLQVIFILKKSQKYGMITLYLFTLDNSEIRVVYLLNYLALEQ